MSVKVSSWVWHGEETAGLAGNAMILLLALADVADDNGRCRYLADDDDLTYESLADKARVSRSTLIRLISGLRDAGLIEQAKGVKGKPNEFRVLVPWSQKSGVNLTPNENEVSSGEDSVSNATGFGVKPDEHTSLIRIDVSDVDTSNVASDDDDEIGRLCDLLAELVRANGHKVETVGLRWRQSCDRLIRIDGYTVEQIEWMIRWATADEFWSANIRSMSTLREKFSQLVANAKRDAAKRQRTAPAARAASVVDIGRRLDQTAGRAS
ncbi:helix-turn-helix domain-containing protein [Microbacterium trichothecenolyticum]|uniref:helix-turn-helix domain-containing protein n=1 Tax=Microbacterium trichothecenolyticum TaxID=69370 RepID=UPI0035BE5122